MSKEINPIEAQIFKISTMPDGGARLTLDLGTQDSEIIAELLKAKMNGYDLIKFVLLEYK